MVTSLLENRSSEIIGPQPNPQRSAAEPQPKGTGHRLPATADLRLATASLRQGTGKATTKNQNFTTEARRHGVAEPQPKPDIHHGGTETRRKPLEGKAKPKVKCKTRNAEGTENTEKSGGENLRKKRRNLRLVIRRKPKAKSKVKTKVKTKIKTSPPTARRGRQRPRRKSGEHEGTMV